MPSRTNPANPAAQQRIFTTDETIRGPDEIVRTAEEMVRTTDDAIERLTVTEDEAALALVEAFGAAMEEDYIPGKTRLRDAIAARFDLDALAAEELCDALERSGRIKFVSGDEGAGWQISTQPAIEPEGSVTRSGRDR